MNKILKITIALSIVASYIAFISFAIITHQPYDYKRTVVKVLGKSGHGSGSVIYSDMKQSLILTNRHVCVGATLDYRKINQLKAEFFECLKKRDEDCVMGIITKMEEIMKPENSVGKSLNIQFNNLERDDVTGNVYSVSKSSDLCLVHIPVPNLPVIKVSRYRAIPTQHIFSLSNPQNMTNHLTEGYVGDDLRYRGNTYQLHTAPIYGGSSGSPVVNDDGEVVGVTTFGTHLATQAYMVPVGDIMLFLIENGIRWSK